MHFPVVRLVNAEHVLSGTKFSLTTHTRLTSWGKHWNNKAVTAECQLVKVSRAVVGVRIRRRFRISSEKNTKRSDCCTPDLHPTRRVCGNDFLESWCSSGKAGAQDSSELTACPETETVGLLALIK